MKEPTDPAALADRLAGEIASLGQQVQRASMSLAELRQVLAAQPRAQAPAPAQPYAQPGYGPTYAGQPVPGPQYAQPYPYPYPGAAPQQQPPVQHYARQQQPQQQPPPRYPGPPPRPQEPRERWWERDGVISRVLAIAGSAVTLVGVVMLLVLAAQAGFFGPAARVASGAVLSVGLIAVGMRISQRPGGRVGAMALAATGIAGLYLDVVAVTVIYEWVHPLFGLAVAMGIAAAGLTLAVKWESQALALIVTLGVAVLGPVVTDGITAELVAFLLVLSVASFPTQLGRDWRLLQVARTGPLVFALLIALVDAALDGSGQPTGLSVALLAMCVVTAVFGTASTLVLVRGGRKDVTAVIMMAVSGIPVLMTESLVSRPVFVTVMAVLAAAACAVIVGTKGAMPAVRAVLAALAALAVFNIVFSVSNGQLRVVVLLVVALALAVVAVTAQSRLAYFAGLAFGVVGVFGQLDRVSPYDLMEKEFAAREGFGAVVASVLVVAVVAALLTALRTLSWSTDGWVEVSWLVGGLVGLYGLTAAVVTSGVLLIDGEAGFIGGHAAATMLWMALSVGLLLWGLRSTDGSPSTWALGAGLTLAAAAVAKLVLFDLAALDGLYRVLAFLTVGVLLLVAGTRYARAFAERGATEAADPEPAAK